MVYVMYFDVWLVRFTCYLNKNIAVMFIVAITGGLGTGKTTVLSIFRKNGIAVIDADQVARKVLQQGKQAWKEVREFFGKDVFLPNGEIDRVKLGQIVFDDVDKRQKLNSITHPRIQKAMIYQAIKYFLSGHKYIVMEVPLLFETGKMIQFINKIITVVCDDRQQLDRICMRNDFTEVIARQRIKCQMPLETKIAKSHFVIDNSKDIDFTQKQTKGIIQTFNTSNFSWYSRSLFLLEVVLLVTAVIFLYKFVR